MNTLKEVKDKTVKLTSNALQPVIAKNREKWWRKLEEDFDLEKGTITNQKNGKKTMASLTNDVNIVNDVKQPGTQNPLEAAYWRLVWSETDNENRLVPVSTDTNNDSSESHQLSSVSNTNALEYFQHEYDQQREEESVIFENTHATGGTSPSRKQRVFKFPPQKGKHRNGAATANSDQTAKDADTEPFLDLRKENRFVLHRAHARYFCTNCIDFPCWTNKLFICWIAILIILLYVVVVVGVVKLLSI